MSNIQSASTTQHRVREFCLLCFATIALATLNACDNSGNKSDDNSGLETETVDARTSAPTLSRDAELAEFKRAIRAKYDMKEQAFRDNDPEPILTRFYSDAAISTDPEGNTKVGRAELRPVYEEVIGALVRVESYNTFVNGDAGWDWVNFHVSFPPGVEEEPFTFKMLFLWERIDSEWWCHGEMYVLGEFEI